MKKTEYIVVRISKELKSRIKSESKKKKTRPSAFIRNIIEQWIYF